ncbi:hypothetical protein AVEN_218912-1, partial [Araneus ventricosus]
MTPSPPSPNFRTTPQSNCFTAYVYFNLQQAHLHAGTSVESGFELGTHLSRSPDLTTRPLSVQAEGLLLNL